MHVIDNTADYDVCIVGSGAGGGMAAKVLTEAGAKVALLEAGPDWDNSQFSHAWPYDSPRRGAATEKQQFGEFDACFGGWTLEGEPYTSADDTEFDWWRARMVGGRTNHWGRISLRFGPDDFNRYSIDGLGADWPIEYEDLKPYYDRIDRSIGLFGSEEGIYNEPDGIFMKPPRPRCYEQLIAKGCDNLGIPVIPSRLSIITEPLDGRAACHYCAQCNRGCATASNFQSPTVLLPDAQATGNLTLITSAMAHEVTTDQEGRAAGVNYIDKNEGRQRHIKADIVVLAASAIESARILLNSSSSRFPNGLANSSGALGHYIMDTSGSAVSGIVPEMLDDVPHNCDGVGGGHIYMPWWLDNKKDVDFPRAYHIEVGGGRHMPGYGIMGGIENYNGSFGGDRSRGGGGYGQQLKDDYRRFYGSMIHFAGRGAMVVRKENRIEIDSEVVDQWGIPVPKFHFQWTDYEYRQARHMQETFRSIIHELGGTPTTPMPTREEGYYLKTPGRIIHEVGGVRMGTDPRNSVLNGYCQAHDVDNLFIADGASMPTQAEKNPTWTILALSMRTSEYIVDQRKKGNI